MEFALTGLSLPLRIRPSVPMTDDELMAFCAKNDFYNVEREPDGDLSVMLPPGTANGNRNAGIGSQLSLWNRLTESGIVFSHAGFTLPDSSMRSPDQAWLSLAKWNALSRRDKERFAPVCPEFVIELLSPFEELAGLQCKMMGWIANGAHLGWLIDPQKKAVCIYRSGRTEEWLDDVSKVSGEGPVAGFLLSLTDIWDANGQENKGQVGMTADQAAVTDTVPVVSMTKAVLRDGWYSQLIDTRFDLLKPGVYEWRIDGVGVYIGKATLLRDRINAYPRNVRKMIEGHPWHGDEKKEYRPIQRALRKAHDEGIPVTVAVLTNCVSGTRAAECERAWIRLRRQEAFAGGPPVLNGY
jgi:Uma2 family endonuclease